ncbi:Stk1 family PASTA domain-containing Ser/Thr kinase [Paenibacillus sp. FJAT-26967]|uniref:Stk1 family PASTA domain-containing Ser/Thr kinase n=1 Tax=Paenibacillus sp. FJAT-26967 TaxID=1729690 RepID=UPI0008383792|nr:PASTA domain-containing protein [Paenibacillus sp. FJAT-26967]
MEQRIGERYVLFEPVHPLADGVMYAGKDLSLHRDVFLLMVEKTGDDFASDYLRVLGQAAQFSDERFFHILNAGVTDHHLYAVLTAQKGNPLLARLGRHQMRGNEVLAAIFELGKGMQEAMEEQISGYSVTAENMWLTEYNGLKVMNYWSPGKLVQRGSLGLCTLLYQICTHSRQAPSNFEQYQSNLIPSLDGLTSAQKEAFLALARRVFREEVSLSSFTFNLREIIALEKNETAPPKQVSYTAAPIVEREASTAREDAPSRENVPPRRSAPAAPYAEPAREEAAAVRTRSPQQRTPVKERAEEDVPKNRIALSRTIWVLGTAAVLLLAIAGFMYLGLPDAPEQQADPNPAATPAPPVPSPTVNTTSPTPTATPTEAVAGEVPNLVGLSQSEAEKLAVEAGMRYKFFLEPNEQEKGKVFRQEPGPNTPAAKGDTITFWVSKGT